MILEWIISVLGGFLIITTPIYLIVGFIAEKISIAVSRWKGIPQIYFRAQKLIGKIGIMLMIVLLVFAGSWLIHQLILFQK